MQKKELIQDFTDKSQNISQEGTQLYRFKSVAEVLEQVQKHLRESIDGESVGYKRENTLRQESAIKRVIYDMGGELEKVLLSPLFSEERLSKILTETQNFSAEDLQDFLSTYVDQQHHHLFTQTLPLDFTQLKDLDEEALEFLKRRLIYYLGSDTYTDNSRALLLQTMKYLGCGYDEAPNNSGCKSQYGINIEKFAMLMGKQQSNISNTLTGNKPVGPLRIMQLIDIILHYNMYGDLHEFKNTEQSLYGNEELYGNIDQQRFFPKAIQYRVEKLSERLGWNLTEINFKNIEEYYIQGMKYISGDMQKFQKLIIYIYMSDYLGIQEGMEGFNRKQLADSMGMSREQWNPKKWDKRYHNLFLSALIVVIDKNEGREDFSKDRYQELKKITLKIKREINS